MNLSLHTLQPLFAGTLLYIGSARFIFCSMFLLQTLDSVNAKLLKSLENLDTVRSETLICDTCRQSNLNANAFSRESAHSSVTASNRWRENRRTEVQSWIFSVVFFPFFLFFSGEGCNYKGEVVS